MRDDEGTHPMVRCMAELPEGTMVNAELTTGSMIVGELRRGADKMVIHIDGWTVNPVFIVRFQTK